MLRLQFRAPIIAAADSVLNEPRAEADLNPVPRECSPVRTQSAFELRTEVENYNKRPPELLKIYREGLFIRTRAMNSKLAFAAYQHNRQDFQACWRQFLDVLHLDEGITAERSGTRDGAGAARSEEIYGMSATMKGKIDENSKQVLWHLMEHACGGGALDVVALLWANVIRAESHRRNTTASLNRTNQGAQPRIGGEFLVTVPNLRQRLQSIGGDRRG